MGSAIDYFRPIQGKTYCEMLQNYNLHQWSRDTSNWITPTFYSGHGKLNRRGGSSHRFPQTWQDTRTYVSFWGSTEGSSSRTKGGCCHSHVGYDDNGNMKTDKSGWGKPFSLYYVDGTQTEEKPLTMSHLPGKFLKVERV